MKYFETLSDYLRRRSRGMVIALIVAVFALYLPYFGSPFVFDDANFFLGDAADYYAHAGFHFDLRWLPNATLGWTYAAFSDELTYPYHLGSILLHAANVVALFYLLRQLFGAAVSRAPAGAAADRGAFFGALIFAVHPVAVYAAGYMIQRSILMATFFSLLAQLAYLRGLLGGQARWLALSVAAYFLAVFSKEHSVLLPAILAMETLMLRRAAFSGAPLGGIRARAGAVWLTWVAFAAVAVLVVLRARGVLGTPYEAHAAVLFEQQGVAGSVPTQHLLSVLTQAGLFFKYLLLWLVPNPAWMSVDMREPFVASLGAWQGWLGVAGFLAYGAVAAWLLLRSRWSTQVVGFALLYPWLQFLVEFSSIRVQEPFILYRSYLWMPGLLLLVPLALDRWPGKKALIALGVVVLLLVPAAENRLWVFADEYRLWDDAAKLLRTGQEPLAARIYYNRGRAAANSARWAAAAADYERVLADNFDVKQPAVLHHDLGTVYFNLGRGQDALAELDKAIALDPAYAKAYYDKGFVLKAMRRDAEAMQQMAQSCKLHYALACLIAGGRMDKSQ